MLCMAIFCRVHGLIWTAFLLRLYEDWLKLGVLSWGPNNMKNGIWDLQWGPSVRETTI